MTKRYFNQVPYSSQGESVDYFKAINWDILEDGLDKATWEKLSSQIWLDTRVPVSLDLKDWRKMSDIEKETYNKAFIGLTLLDTLQQITLDI